MNYNKEDLYIRWDPAKNLRLKKDRGRSFREVLNGRFLGMFRHKTRSHQRVLLFELDGYVWVIPSVFRNDELFLKTLFPSRQLTRRWKRGELI